MMMHFLLTDLKTRRLSLVMAFLMCVGCFISIRNESSEGAIGSITFLFILANLVLTSAMGTRMRSQHQMSRNFMLALPIRREAIFNTIQLRALLFSLPALICFLACLYSEFRFTVADWGFYLPVMIVALPSLVLLINTQALATLDNERSISGQYTSGQRMGRWLFVFMTGFPKVLISFGAVYLTASFPMASIILFPAVTVFSYYQYRMAQRSWIGV